MYAVNQCSDPRDFVSPRYKAVKVSVLSSKSIFSVDAKAVTSDVDVQKVRSAVLYFTFDLFENSTPHFLDINIASDGLGIYRKDTFTGQYTNFDSFVPWRHKISWVRALIDRIHRICTPYNIKTELKLIRKFLSWNGFPKRVANLLIERFTTNA